MFNQLRSAHNHTIVHRNTPSFKTSASPQRNYALPTRSTFNINKLNHVNPVIQKVHITLNTATQIKQVHYPAALLSSTTTFNVVCPPLVNKLHNNSKTIITSVTLPLLLARRGEID
jgi:hypothetical protein